MRMSFPVCESVNYSFKKFNHRNTLLLELLRTSCVHDWRNSSVVPWCISYNSDHPLSIFHWNEFRPKLRSWVSAFFWTWIDPAMFSLPQQSMAVSSLHQVLFLRRDSSHRIDCAHINSEEYEEPTKQDVVPFTNHETNLVHEVLEEPTRWNAVPFTNLRKELGARSAWGTDKTRFRIFNAHRKELGARSAWWLHGQSLTLFLKMQMTNRKGCLRIVRNRCLIWGRGTVRALPKGKCHASLVFHGMVCPGMKSRDSIRYIY